MAATSQQHTNFLSEEEIDTLAALQEDSPHTTKAIKYAKTKIEIFAAAGNISIPSIARNKGQLDSFVSTLFAALRKGDGSYFTKHSLFSIRYGIQRYFHDQYDCDITDKEDFPKSNEIYKAVLRKIKEEGKWNKQQRQPISQADMEKIMSSQELDCTKPSGLQNKVFIDIMTCFYVQGRENIRLMRPTDFSIEKMTNGQRRISLGADAFAERTGPNAEYRCDYGAQTDSYLSEISDKDRCPVRSFLFYVSKLDSRCPFLWQKPARLPPVGDEGPWYLNVPLGKNTIGTIFREIAKKAGCTKVYTHHSLLKGAYMNFSTHQTEDWAASSCDEIASVQPVCIPASNELFSHWTVLVPAKEAKVFSEEVRPVQMGEGQRKLVTQPHTSTQVPVCHGTNGILEGDASTQLEVESQTRLDRSVHARELQNSQTELGDKHIPQRHSLDNHTELDEGTLFILRDMHERYKVADDGVPTQRLSQNKHGVLDSGMHIRKERQQRKRGVPDINDGPTADSDSYHDRQGSNTQTIPNQKRQRVTARERGTQSDPLHDAENVQSCYTCQQELGINGSRISLSSVQKGVRLMDALRKMHLSGLFPTDDDSLASSFCCLDCTNLVIEFYSAANLINRLKDSWTERTGLHPKPSFTSFTPTISLRSKETLAISNCSTTGNGGTPSHPQEHPPPLGPVLQQPFATASRSGQLPPDANDLPTVVDAGELVVGDFCQVQPNTRQQFSTSKDSAHPRTGNIDSRHPCARSMDSGQTVKEVKDSSTDMDHDKLKGASKLAMGVMLECNDFSGNSDSGSVGVGEDILSLSSDDSSHYVEAGIIAKETIPQQREHTYQQQYHQWDAHESCRNKPNMQSYDGDRHEEEHVGLHIQPRSPATSSDILKILAVTVKQEPDMT